MNHAYNIDLHESQQKATLAAIIPVIIIAAASVICRFVARRLQKLKLGLDDYLILVGLVFTIGCFSLSVEMVHLGSGKHLLTVPLDNITIYLKVGNPCHEKRKSTARLTLAR